MKQILITATHPRSGLTRIEGATLTIGSANGDDTITEFDAIQCVAEGRGQWVNSKAPRAR